jgi:hypothetical protein
MTEEEIIYAKQGTVIATDKAAAVCVIEDISLWWLTGNDTLQHWQEIVDFIPPSDWTKLR